MIAAICCPGPSLPTAFGRRTQAYDEVYAVNRAALAIGPYHWLCAGDKSFFRGLLTGSPCPQIGIITMAENIMAAMDVFPVQTNDRAGITALYAWEGLDLFERHAALTGRPINWSVQVALCHAAERHIQIDLYGCDMAGIEDCTGYRGEDRSDDRWQRERQDLALTIDLLASKGITVTKKA